MDLYEEGLYLLMLVAATVLVAVVITLMTKSMLKKKPESTGQLTIPASASAQQVADAKSDQEPAGKPEEQRQEQLQNIAPAKQLKQATEKPDTLSAALDEKETEIEVELETEDDAEEDTMDIGQIALPGIENEDSILSAVEESDDLMNLFQSVEDDNSELAELAARLPDVDLDSLKVLSQETFLALSKRTAGKKEE